MVEQQTHEGEVVSSNPTSHISREICSKITATSMARGAGRTGAGRWRPSPKIKFLLLFLGFFRIFILPSVNLCRVLFRYSAKSLPSVRQKTLGKVCLPTKIRRVFFRLPLALGKYPDSRSVRGGEKRPHIGGSFSCLYLPVSRHRGSLDQVGIQHSSCP